MRIRCLVAYDGTHYLGWQKTEMGPSIEQTLEEVFVQILQHPVQLDAASRTDAGVHARGQVVCFSLQKPNLDLTKLRKSANALLPEDIAILSMEKAVPEFHPTLDCTGKEYIYQVCLGDAQSPFYRFFSWHFPYSIDHGAIQKACQLIIGTHDFSTFCNERKLWTKDTVRTIFTCSWEQIDEERYQIRISGNNFLYRMVRNVAGTLLYIGCGKIPLESLNEIMKGKDRTLAGVTAPALGLTLNKVFY